MTTTEEGGQVATEGEAAKKADKTPKVSMTATEEAWDLAKTVFFAVAIALAEGLRAANADRWAGSGRGTRVA